jgi:hypothetical protein
MRDVLPEPAKNEDTPPYLSVVAVSRNDDHGGDPLRRTQLFIDSLAWQVGRYSLSTESHIRYHHGDRLRLEKFLSLCGFDQRKVIIRLVAGLIIAARRRKLAGRPRVVKTPLFE